MKRISHQLALLLHTQKVILIYFVKGLVFTSFYFKILNWAGLKYSAATQICLYKNQLEWNLLHFHLQRQTWSVFMMYRTISVLRYSAKIRRGNYGWLWSAWCPYIRNARTPQFPLQRLGKKDKYFSLIQCLIFFSFRG